MTRYFMDLKTGEIFTEEEIYGGIPEWAIPEFEEQHGMEFIEIFPEI